MSRLHSQQSGNGPVLVMLHGLFGDLDNFRSVSLHMERGLSIVRMDLPGHGKSPTNASLTIENMAELVLDELAALGIRKYYLLGHSLGGKVAMAVAGNPRAKGLQRLCIVDIAPKQYPPHHQEIFDALLSIRLDLLEERRQADAQLRSAVTDAGVRAFLLKGLYQHESKRFRWRFDVKQLAADYPNISQPPKMLRKVDVPTLFIKGGNSDYLSADDEAKDQTTFFRPVTKNHSRRRTLATCRETCPIQSNMHRFLSQLVPVNQRRQKRSEAVQLLSSVQCLCCTVHPSRY